MVDRRQVAKVRAVVCRGQLGSSHVEGGSRPLLDPYREGQVISEGKFVG